MALKQLERGQFDSVLTPSLLIMLQCYYPRIDRGPLCEKKHLIKLPFSVHKDTRNVALPIGRNVIAEKPGLPLTQLAFKTLMEQYRQTQGRQIHPDFIEACRIFREWVEAY